MNYSTMKNLKEEIIARSERELILGFSLKYILIGLILIPYYDHYISIIINPAGKYIKKEFKNFKIFKQDILDNNGLLTELKDNEDILNFGMPYILILKNLFNYLKIH